VRWLLDMQLYFWKYKFTDFFLQYTVLKLWVPHRPSLIEAADQRVVMRLSTSMVYLLKRVL
jgi:hypothetical protein